MLLPRRDHSVVTSLGPKPIHKKCVDFSHESKACAPRFMDVYSPTYGAMILIGFSIYTKRFGKFSNDIQNKLDEKIDEISHFIKYQLSVHH